MMMRIYPNPACGTPSNTLAMSVREFPPSTFAKEDGEVVKTELITPEKCRGS